MKFKKGQRVIKDSGDYTFNGKVVAAFKKLSGVDRYVVEDSRGLLFIFSEGNLKRDIDEKTAKRLTSKQRKNIAAQMKARWKRRMDRQRAQDRLAKKEEGSWL